jgi:hypothetical protein
MFKKFLHLYFVMVWFIASPAPCQLKPYQSTVNMFVQFTPSLTNINGKTSLYYELYLTNFAKDSLEIESLAAINPANSSTVYHCNGDMLKTCFVRIGKAQKDTAPILPPGASGVFFLEYDLPVTGPAISLVHQVKLNVLKGHQKTMQIINGAALNIPASRQLVIGPPLAGGPWAAIYDPSWATGHRRVFYTVNGTARLPGRFAIDFIKVDTLGRYAGGNDNEIKNWYGYGNDVLAVYDGVISSVRNDFAESPTLSGYVATSAENATGNYISIKIGDGQYVFYEHLKPGSIKVKPGEKVTKGQMIASIGFTGQTTGPHLHLHVANADSPLGAEGIPFEFEQYYFLGRYINLNHFGKARWVPAGPMPQPIKKEHPAPNSVIKFE